jgi:uncharacterized membrane protein
MPKARDFFSAEQQQLIVHAIQQSEGRTSGEIRVHLEEKCGGDAYKRATALFTSLKMDKTELRNGILIYLAVADKQFAIIGDAGIHAKVQQVFWDTIKDVMVHHFRNGDFAGGLIAAITSAGEQLQHFFPRESDDRNEMTDEISFRDA